MAHFIPFPDKFHLADEFMQHNYCIDNNDCGLSAEHRLAIYSLRQQALHGKNRTPAPSWWNALERAKWDAWASLDQMSQLEAMVFYVQLVEKEVDANWLSKVSPPPANPPAPTADSSMPSAPTSPSESAPSDPQDPPVKQAEARAKPGTEEEMWAALQEAWHRLDATGRALEERAREVADLKERCAAESRAADLLRTQNGLLQGQLQEALGQQAAAAKVRLLPKRPVAKAAPSSPTTPTKPPHDGVEDGTEGGHAGGSDGIPNGAPDGEEPRRRPSDGRIVNYYYSETPQKGWWGWLQPW